MQDKVKIILPAAWEPKETVETGKEPVLELGITETLDVVDFFATGGAAFIAAKEDGKINLADLPKFWAMMQKLPAAISGISLVPQELLGIDLEEAQDVVDSVLERFPQLATAEKTKYVINEAVKGAVAFKNVIDALV